MSERLERSDHAQLREIISELSIVKLGQSDSLATLMAAMHDLLQFEGVGVYCVRNRTGRWLVERTVAAGAPVSRAVELARLMFQNTRTFPVYYNPHTPPRGQRNRAMDAYAWIQEHQADTWDEHPMCVDVLRPLGLHRHHQPRALLCNGPVLLGWFGGLSPDAPTKRQMRMMSALVMPLRDRLEVEERLCDSVPLRPALDVMLDRLGTAAFVVNSKGGIQEANEGGRALLTPGNRDLCTRIRHATVGCRRIEGIEVIPIQNAQACAWIVIVGGGTREERVRRCVDACAMRWTLTPRQTEVLHHVARGMSNLTIATELGCVERTVELHVTALLDRAGVDSRAALVSVVLTTGL